MNALTRPSCPPLSHTVTPRSRTRLLEAMESVPSATFGEVARLSGLSQKTVRCTARQLIQEGILDGRGMASDGRERRLRFARTPSLPLLELGQAHTLFRLGDTCLDSVFAVIRDGGEDSREADVAWVLRRAEELLVRGLSGEERLPTLCQPVILFGDGEHSKRLTEQAQWAFSSWGAGCPPVTLSVSQAMAEELSRLPEVKGHALVLWVETHPCLSARLFVRESGGGGLIPLPLEEMGQYRSARGVSSRDPAEEQTVALLERIGSILPVDCVLLETALSPECLTAIADRLPSRMTLHSYPTDINTPSIAHRGALRIARHRLWASMAEAARRQDL